MSDEYLSDWRNRLVHRVYRPLCSVVASAQEYPRLRDAVKKRQEDMGREFQETPEGFMYCGVMILKCDKVA